MKSAFSKKRAKAHHFVQSCKNHEMPTSRMHTWAPRPLASLHTHPHRAKLTELAKWSSHRTFTDNHFFFFRNTPHRYRADCVSDFLPRSTVSQQKAHSATTAANRLSSPVNQMSGMTDRSHPSPFRPCVPRGSCATTRFARIGCVFFVLWSRKLGGFVGIG